MLTAGIESEKEVVLMIEMVEVGIVTKNLKEEGR